MKLYAFASASLVNIWAGVGAQMWAVPESKTAATNSGRTSKAAKMPLGAAGILYSSADKCFTSPFIVHGRADEDAVIRHVWDGPWILPFKIRTLGNPHARLEWSEAKKILPSCLAGEALKTPIHVEPLTVFAASEIAESDWATLIERLAN